jgi:hypothetical protein
LVKFTGYSCSSNQFSRLQKFVDNSSYLSVYFHFK